MLLLYAICGVLLLAVVGLTIKVCLMRKSMNEILSCLEEHLTEDSNAPILISSGDPYVKRLANELNRHLKEMRRLRYRYLEGDRELKEAVTNVSHDLRTPLTALSGYLDLLGREELSAEALRYLHLIRDRAEAMRRLTEELFRYSVVASKPTLALEEVELGRCLEEAMLSFYGPFSARGIRPEVQLPSVPVCRFLDPSAVRRVLDNVISNAVKYSDGDFAVTLKEEGRMTFSNTAHALSSVEIGRLFDRFYTVESAHPSTGLGLSIAKLLVERMGGELSAAYRDGKLWIDLQL